MKRRPPKTNGTARDVPGRKREEKSLERRGDSETPSDHFGPGRVQGTSLRDKLALSRMDWTSLMFLALVLLIAPLWAATFATPAQIPLLTPDEIAVSGEVGIVLGIWAGPLILLTVSAAFCVMVWREWKRPVAIGAVTGLAGAFALLGIWAIIASARNHALYLSLNTLSYLFAALLLAGMTSRLGRDPRGVAALLLTLAIAGSIVAGIGVNEYLAYWKEGAGEHRVFSTFLPDFLAGYLLLTLPATLSAFAAIQGRALRMALGVGLCLQSACLLLTGSRAGVAIALMTVLVWLGLCVFTGATRGKWKVVGLALCIFAIGAAVSAAPTLARFGSPQQAPPQKPGPVAPAVSAPPPAETQDHSSAFRKYTWIGAVRMAVRNPLFGTGTGTFDIAYPRYAETAYTSHAHNSYLQWMGETGIPGVLLLLTGFAAASAFVVNILLLIRNRVREAGKNGEDLEATGEYALEEGALLTSPRIVLAGLGAAFIASLLHSLFDSDWYIIATLLTFSAVLGLLVAQARALAPLATQTPRTLGREFALIGLLLCGFMVWRGGQIGWSRWERAQIGRPDRGLEALDSMRAAVATDPFDPEPHLVLAQMFHRRPEEETELQAAARLSPSGKTYYLLGRYFEEKQAWKPALDAFEQSRAFDPHNLQTLRALAETEVKAGLPDQARLTYQTISALEHMPFGTVRAMPELIETDFAYAHAGIADIAFESKDWKGAEAEYLQALRILRAYWPTRHWMVNAARLPEKRRALVGLYAHVLDNMQSVLKNQGRTAEIQPYAEEQQRVEADARVDTEAEQRAAQTGR